MIRVLVVDDHAVVRSGLRLLIGAEPDIEAVGEAPNADRAVFEAIELKPNVVLMDLVMPEKGGIEGMPAVLKAVPTAKVLVLRIELSCGLEKGGDRLSPQLEDTVYRVVQEALSNVIRHSGAARADVSVKERDRRVVIVVADDGAGFVADGESSGFSEMLSATEGG